ncbi:MAG: aminotransferase class I/II-fold pyridoxal phosphate-dependent enzyme [Candidatus Riflebacteria bacterium]|nr:aminotransferase class I/II-fold pyridoxal phosphate-dependent enzyme [Candidatus Riflebacteria bacterium]
MTGKPVTPGPVPGMPPAPDPGDRPLGNEAGDPRPAAGQKESVAAGNVAGGPHSAEDPLMGAGGGPATTEALYEPPPDSPDLFAKAQAFLPRLQAVQDAGGYFYRRVLTTACGNRVRVRDPQTGAEREMILFASNSYLGLATHPRVVEAARRAAATHGYGSGSVALMSGTSDLHLELEARIARFYRCEAACLFPSGYHANVGTIQALLGPRDVALADLYAHASIIDGVQLSEGTLKYFPHNDPEALEALLRKAGKHFLGRLIVTDGVFSMDGDLAPLDRLAALAGRHGARLLIDEAHALGIVGPTGRGTAEVFGLEGKIDLTIGTLSKAPAGLGGYLTGRREVVEYVRHFARSYIFSTSLPAPTVAGLIEVFRLLEEDPAPRQALQANTAYLLDGLHRLGFDTLGSTTAIIPVLIPDEHKLRLACRELHERGLYVTPVTFPAVARGRARLRLSLSSTHTRADLDLLLSVLEDLKGKLHLDGPSP